jgi:Glyoxalase-like domain
MISPGLRARQQWVRDRLDFLVHDADAAEARVLAAGATKFDVQPGDHFRVYADPAGHPFCLCIEGALSQA